MLISGVATSDALVGRLTFFRYVVVFGGFSRKNPAGYEDVVSLKERSRQYMLIVEKKKKVAKTNVMSEKDEKHTILRTVVRRAPDPQSTGTLGHFTP